MCQAASTTPILNTHVEFPTAVSIRKASLRQVSTRWKNVVAVPTTRAHRFWKDILAHRTGGRRAGKSCKRKVRPIQYTAQYFSLYANESRIETSALSKRHIHVEKKLGSGAGMPIGTVNTLARQGNNNAGVLSEIHPG